MLLDLLARSVLRVLFLFRLLIILLLLFLLLLSFPTNKKNILRWPLFLCAGSFIFYSNQVSHLFSLATLVVSETSTLSSVFAAARHPSVEMLSYSLLVAFHPHITPSYVHEVGCPNADRLYLSCAKAFGANVFTCQ